MMESLSTLNKKSTSKSKVRRFGEIQRNETITRLIANSHSGLALR